MLRAQINQAVMMTTGLLPGPGGTSTVPSGYGNVASAGSPEGQGGPLPGTQVMGGPVEGMVNNIVAKAYGARFAQRRMPDEE